MALYPFHEIVIIGELEFEVTGTYYPEESNNGFYMDNVDERIPYDINFETVSITLDTDNDGTITLDGTKILDSLKCWDVLEEELVRQLPDLDFPIFEDDEDIY